MHGQSWQKTPIPSTRSPIPNPVNTGSVDSSPWPMPSTTKTRFTSPTLLRVSACRPVIPVRWDPRRRTCRITASNGPLWYWRMLVWRRRRLKVFKTFGMSTLLFMEIGGWLDCFALGGSKCFESEGFVHYFRVHEACWRSSFGWIFITWFMIKRC